MANYIAHHGVKGQKWGVRKQTRFASKRLGRQSAFGKRLGYTDENFRGREKQRSVRINAVDRAILKSKRAVNFDGSVTTESQAAYVRRYAKGKKAVQRAEKLAAAGLATYFVVSKGKTFVGKFKRK